MLGVLIAAFAAIILTGWYAQAPALLRLHPSFVAVQFNTAVGFLLIGLALIGGALGYRLAPAAAAALAALLGLLTLLEHLGLTLTGLDQLLWSLGVNRAAMEAFTIYKTSVPGRMALSSAVCLTLTGIALFWMITRWRRAATLAPVLGVAVSALGLVALTGYLVGAPSAFGWADLTRMAVHTAAAFSIAGLGIVFLAAGLLHEEGVSFTRRIPWLVAAGGIIMSFGVFQALNDKQHSDLDRDTQLGAERVRADIASQIDARLGPLTRIARRWAYEGHTPRVRDYETELNFHDFADWKSLGWIDSRSRLRWSLPHLDRPVSNLWTPDEAAEANRRSDAMVARRTIALPNADREFVAFVPIASDGASDGFLYGIFDLRELLDSASFGRNHADYADYAVSVFSQSERIYAHNAAVAARGMTHELGVDLPGVVWRIRVSPTSERAAAMDSRVDETALALGLLLTTLLVWVIHLTHLARTRELTAAKAEEHLKQETAAVQHAHELEVTNEKLRHEAAERLRAECERQGLEEQLRQAQKLEAVGQLAGGIAHDFNNMLTAIKGYSEILLSDLDPLDACREDVMQIQKAADRSAQLTGQLLAFSRKQVLQPTVLDLNEVVAGIENMLRRLIRENIELTVTASPNLGSIEADRGQLEQILMNLVVNARDAMPRGGTLSLSTAGVRLDETYTDSYVVIQPGSYVVLTVSDNGTGMDRATKERIFEPFFTTKGRTEGTGLGLSTVYGIVKQSGGHIWVHSEPDLGTTFRIYFPRVEGHAVVVPIAARSAELTSGAETILLAEDEEAVRSLLVKILNKRGYTVIEAAHGGEALRVCKEHPSAIDLIVTDVIMPEMSGRELVERLKALRPKARVLFMSGYTDGELDRCGVLNGRLAFLQKPFTSEELARKVREVLDRGDPEAA